MAQLEMAVKDGCETEGADWGPEDNERDKERSTEKWEGDEVVDRR